MPPESQPIALLAERAEEALRAFREALDKRDAALPQATPAMLGTLLRLEGEFQATRLSQGLLKLGGDTVSLPQVKARLDAVNKVYVEDRKRRFGNYKHLLRLVAIMAVEKGMKVTLDGPMDDPVRFLLLDLPTGQVSFGIPNNVGRDGATARDLLDGIPVPDSMGRWDHHTKEEKNDRIRAFLPAAPKSGD